MSDLKATVRTLGLPVMVMARYAHAHCPHLSKKTWHLIMSVPVMIVGVVIATKIAHDGYWAIVCHTIGGSIHAIGVAPWVEAWIKWAEIE